MAIIRFTCEDHGDLEVGSADVTVRICSDNGKGSYLLRCPEDGAIIVRDTEHRNIELLEASGCKIEMWTLPKELKELKERKDDPVIDHDDLIDFHTFIHNDLAVETALGGLQHALEGEPQSYLEYETRNLPRGPESFE